MARSGDASFEVNPKEIEDIIKQDKYDDCLACRATGERAYYQPRKSGTAS